MPAKRQRAFHRRSTGYVWCDAHGEIHPAKFDYYLDNEDCHVENWRPVFVQTTDRTEEF